MKIDQLISGIPTIERINWDPHRKIKKITSDSRTVDKDDLFVACPGARMDGNDFVGQAVYAGASVVIFDKLPESGIPRNVTAVLVPDSRKCFSLLLRKYYGFPDTKMKLVGVTGTNGKTTIAYLMHYLLKDKVESAYIGTLGTEFGDNKTDALNTTPGAETLYPLMSQMVNKGVEYCFMEVSSHALEQSRVYGMQFAAALFSQLTQDHLDYHKTMERYYQSKRLLFTNEPKPRHILINRDCAYGRRMLEENLHASSFAMGTPADYYAADVDCTLKGSCFNFMNGKKSVSFTTRLPMRHNVMNATAALGALHLLGFDPAEFRAALQDMPGVPGRLERVPGSEGFEVFVDYAHTPDACERVLGEAKRLNPKRILTLLGCGGDRDQEKRPLMAAVAATYSDIFVMTSDNPRSEDPDNIIRDMRRGIHSSSEGRSQVIEILDRRQAIEKILSLAEPGDVVFILGKGHEDYQILGDNKISFDDRLVVRDFLNRKNRVFFS